MISIERFKLIEIKRMESVARNLILNGHQFLASLFFFVSLHSIDFHVVGKRIRSRARVHIFRENNSLYGLNSIRDAPSAFHFDWVYRNVDRELNESKWLYGHIKMRNFCLLIVTGAKKRHRNEENSTYPVMFVTIFDSISLEGILKRRKKSLHSCLMNDSRDRLWNNCE